MRRTHRGVIVAIAVLCTCAACAERPEATATRVDVESEREALLEADRRFARASEEGNSVDAFYAFLADDALMLPAGAEPVHGRDAIRELMASGPASTLLWEPQQAEVAASGDLGWTWGTYESRGTSADGTATVRFGKYVNIWRKQADGNWKVVVDIGNASPAPEGR